MKFSIKHFFIFCAVQCELIPSGDLTTSVQKQMLYSYDLDDDYMIPAGYDKIMSRYYYKLFISYILRLHVKSFILARRDPSFVLPGSCFAGKKSLCPA